MLGCYLDGSLGWRGWLLLLGCQGKVSPTSPLFLFYFSIFLFSILCFVFHLNSDFELFSVLQVFWNS
jgi:hypothetical protein